MDTRDIQLAEDRLLCRAIQDAIRHIDNGEVAAGYQCMLAGLEHATDLLDTGESWAGGLVEAYRSALFEVECHYPVSRRVPMTTRPRSK